MIVDDVFFQESVEFPSADLQGAGGSRLVPPFGLKNPADVYSFERVQVGRGGRRGVFGWGWIGGSGLLDPGRKIEGLDRLAVGQNLGAFDDVGQLADVARPFVAFEKVERVGVDLTRTDCPPSEEVANQ